MIDEKRIKRFIEGAKEAFKEVDDPTFTFPMNILSAYELTTSIEELLKEQEPIQPIHSPYGEWLCGSCMREIDKYAGDYHCPGCGREVKWDE